jgi:hypothetical protein
VVESSIDLLTKDFKRLFKPFLRDLNGLRTKYFTTLGKDCFEATIAEAARQLEKEAKTK